MKTGGDNEDDVGEVVVLDGDNSPNSVAFNWSSLRAPKDDEEKKFFSLFRVLVQGSQPQRPVSTLIYAVNEVHLMYGLSVLWRYLNENATLEEAQNALKEAKAQPSIVGTDPMPKEIAIIQPSVALTLRSGCGDYELSRLVELSQEWTAARKVLIPLGNEENGIMDHWSLLVFEREKNCFQYWDSLMQQNSRAWKNAKKSQRALEGLLQLPAGIPFEPVNECLQQENGHDCGVVVAAWIDAFVARKDPLVLTLQAVEQMRKKIAGVVKNSILHGPDKEEMAKPMGWVSMAVLDYFVERVLDEAAVVAPSSAITPRRIAVIPPDSRQHVDESVNNSNNAPMLSEGTAEPPPYNLCLGIDWVGLPERHLTKREVVSFVCRSLNGPEPQKGLLVSPTCKNILQDISKELEKGVDGYTVRLAAYGTAGEHHVFYMPVNDAALRLFIVPLRPTAVAYTKGPPCRSGEQQVRVTGMALQGWLRRLGGVPWKLLSSSSTHGTVNWMDGQVFEAGQSFPNHDVSVDFGDYEHQQLDYKHPTASLVIQRLQFDRYRDSLLVQCFSTSGPSPNCRLVIGVHDVTRCVIGIGVDDKEEVASWVCDWLNATFPAIPPFFVSLVFHEVRVKAMSNPVLLSSRVGIPQKECVSALVFLDGRAKFEKHENEGNFIVCAERELLSTVCGLARPHLCKDGVDNEWQKLPFESGDIQDPTPRYVIEVIITLPGDLVGVPVTDIGNCGMKELGLWLRAKGITARRELQEALVGNLHLHICLGDCTEIAKTVASLYAKRLVEWNKLEEVCFNSRVILVLHLSTLFVNGKNSRLLIGDEIRRQLGGIDSCKPVKRRCLLVANLESTLQEAMDARTALSSLGFLVEDIVGVFFHDHSDLRASLPSNVPLAGEVSSHVIPNDLYNWLVGALPVSWELMKGGCVPMMEQTTRLLEAIRNPSSPFQVFRLVKVSSTCGASTMIAQLAFLVRSSDSPFVYLWKGRSDVSWGRIGSRSRRTFVFIDALVNVDMYQLIETGRRLFLAGGFAGTVVYVQKVDLENLSDDEGTLIDPFLSANDVQAFCATYRGLGDKVTHRAKRAVERLAKAPLQLQDRHIFIFGLIICVGKFKHAIDFMSACAESVSIDERNLLTALAFVSLYSSERPAISSMQAYQVVESARAECREVLRVKPPDTVSFAHVFFARKWLDTVAGTMAPHLLWQEVSTTLAHFLNSNALRDLCISVLVRRTDGAWFSRLLDPFVSRADPSKLETFLTAYGLPGLDIDHLKDWVRSRMYRSWAMHNRNDAEAQDHAYKSIVFAQKAYSCIARQHGKFERAAKHNLATSYVRASQLEYGDRDHVRIDLRSQNTLEALKLCEELYEVDQSQDVVNLALKIGGMSPTDTKRWEERRESQRIVEQNNKADLSEALLEALREWTD